MIVIFKTSVSNASDEQLLKPHLDTFLKGARWTFDLEDCDKILRIDSPYEITHKVIKILTDRGYACEELPF